jgi:uncharacterized DUF497 family protein
MDIEFDPVKDAINARKHGVSLASAAAFEWETAVVWPDTRFEYDEERLSALGYIGLTLFFMAFVERDDRTRVLSLRKATPMEIKRYAQS